MRVCFLAHRHNFISLSLHRVLTTLENVEILEFVNSGKLRENSGNFCLSDAICCEAVGNTQQANMEVCVAAVVKAATSIFCNSANKILKWLLRWFVTWGFNFIIVWKRLFWGSEKPGKLREFHFAKFVSILLHHRAVAGNGNSFFYLIRFVFRLSYKALMKMQAHHL